jgi:hypothetical protein
MLVKIAAYLHDIGRRDDYDGPQHAHDGVKVAEKYLAPLGLSEIEKKTILFAIAHHADCRAPNCQVPVTANYPEIKEQGLIETVIAGLWDANRLELTRSQPVLAEYLSTATAKVMLPAFNASWEKKIGRPLRPSPSVSVPQNPTLIKDMEEIGTEEELLQFLQRGGTVVCYRGITTKRAVPDPGTILSHPFIPGRGRRTERFIEQIRQTSYPHTPSRYTGVFVAPSTKQALKWGMVIVKIAISLSGTPNEQINPLRWFDLEGYEDALDAEIGGTFRPIGSWPHEYNDKTGDNGEKYLRSKGSHQAVSSEIALDPTQVRIEVMEPLSPEEHRRIFFDNKLIKGQIETPQDIEGILRSNLQIDHPFWQYYGGVELARREAYAKTFDLFLDPVRQALRISDVPCRIDLRLEKPNDPCLFHESIKKARDILAWVEDKAIVTSDWLLAAKEKLEKIDQEVQMTGHEILGRIIMTNAGRYDLDRLRAIYCNACKNAGKEPDALVLAKIEKIETLRRGGIRYS